MIARIQLGRGEVTVDLARPLSLAALQSFAASGPRHFGAPAAFAQPFSAPGFSGAVASGASCNCSTITLTPHSNGTHTECVGHLTVESLDACSVIPHGLLPALVLHVDPVSPDATRESTAPAPKSGDRLITAESIERRWLLNRPLDPNLENVFEPRSLILRTADIETGASPYLSREAAELLVHRGIEHLVVDLPSIDRLEDEGQLTAHRVFFGLPTGSRAITQAARPRATITELAQIPAELSEGWYMLELQAPAIAGDAVPSRPLLYSLIGT